MGRRRHNCPSSNMWGLLKIQNSLLRQRVYNIYFEINMYKYIIKYWILKKSALSFHDIEAVKIIVKVISKKNPNFIQV